MRRGPDRSPGLVGAGRDPPDGAGGSVSMGMASRRRADQGRVPGGPGPHPAGTTRTRRSGERPAQPDVPVDVLVEQVPEPAGTPGVAGLRTEGPQPHEVAGLDLDPVLVEPVDGLA